MDVAVVGKKRPRDEGGQSDIDLALDFLRRNSFQFLGQHLVDVFSVGTRTSFLAILRASLPGDNFVGFGLVAHYLLPDLCTNCTYNCSAVAGLCNQCGAGVCKKQRNAVMAKYNAETDLIVSRASGPRGIPRRQLKSGATP